MTIKQIISFFIKYKYQAIFPIAVAEGPVITIISGFLVSRGILNLIPTLFIVYLGDVISDSVFYFVGKGGRHIVQYLKFFHISQERVEKLENQFALAPWKTMMVAKVSYGLGTVFMLASGASRMSLKNFLEYIMSLDFIRSSILLAIGFYFGRAAIHIGRKYAIYYIVAVIVTFLVLVILHNRKNKKSL